MYIKKIILKNFRNYKEEEIELKNNINLFYGKNAQGKTNIIESIFICSMGKSFRTRQDKELISFNEKETFLKIEYQKIDREGIIKYNIGDKKEIYINNIQIKKMSELLGNINIVIFSPEDINIIKGSPSNRRKFLNMLISQIRPNYIYIYNLYMKTLEQKNTYLKTVNIENKNNKLLDIYDEKLSEYAYKINNYRKEFIDKIKEKIEKIHKKITQEKENIKIKYISDCFEKEKFLQLLKNNRNQDILKGYTSIGIQRDDIYFYINGKKVDLYGSQGQQRTTILSLKLSELEIIKDEIGEYPILLLDDFMSELDKQRRINFLENIKNTQIIITCTEDINIEKIDINKYKVIEGKIYKK